MQHSHLPSRKAGAFEFLVYVVSVLAPLNALPQIWKIWNTKSALDVSLWSWVISTIAVLVWLIYALKIKEKPLIITNIIALILYTIVVIQILIYS